MTVQGADDVSIDIWLCVCGRAEPISGAVAAVRACLLRVHVCCCDTFALLFPHTILSAACLLRLSMATIATSQMENIMTTHCIVRARWHCVRSHSSTPTTTRHAMVPQRPSRMWPLGTSVWIRPREMILLHTHGRDTASWASENMLFPSKLVL